MNLKLKIWLVMGLVMTLLLAAFAIVDQREGEAAARADLHRQALELRAVLMATRRVYHRQFLASGLPVNDQTLGFLPAHSMSRISADFHNWTSSRIRFNNVSDRPRNPANQADASELVAMAWHRANAKATERIADIEEPDGRAYFHYTAPIWTEAYCLNCHASPDTAPPTIRQRYDRAYGYQVGDLRGMMSIKIPLEELRARAMAHWWAEISQNLVMLLILMAILGLLLNRLVIHRLDTLREAARRMTAGDYHTRIAAKGSDEIAELSQGFDRMAAAVLERGRALADNEMKYHILADYSSDWEYWLGADGRYVYVSPACATVCGYPAENFLADPDFMEHLLHPDDVPTWRAHMHDQPMPDQPALAPINTSHRYRMPLRIRGLDGDYRWIEHDCVPVFDADGRYLGRRGVNHDITARKRGEELERFSAFQAGIAEMGATVLHNIGNAITAVTQDAEVIADAGNELARVASLLDENATRTQASLTDQPGTAAELTQRQCAIQHEAARAIRSLTEDKLRQRSRRMGESVKHIAEIVRIQQSAAHPNGRSSSFSLVQAIRSALDMQADSLTRLGIDVSLEVAPGLDQVTLSHNRLLQALVNVLKNGIEAIQERKPSDGFQGRLEIRAEALGEDRLRLSVEDNGIGFEPEHHDQLFRFGFSTKQRGTGFGLHSVAMFAKECGGQASLESTGNGARLTLELPINCTRSRELINPINPPAGRQETSHDNLAQ